MIVSSILSLEGKTNTSSRKFAIIFFQRIFAIIKCINISTSTCSLNTDWTYLSNVNLSAG